MKSNSRNHFQIIWGIILILAGVGVFYRIPQVIPKLAEQEVFSSITTYIKFCFYFIGIVLIGGGVQKVYNNIKSDKSENSED